MVAELITTLAAKGVTEITTALLEDYAKHFFEKDPTKAANIKTDLRPHIDSTYQRCSSFKTLLNPLSPAKFLDIYATQRFIVDSEIIDHYAMVDIIKNHHNNIFITGTGGSGKSMFTRYFWLSMFVDGGGRFPIFVELRNMNNISSDDMNAFIFYSIFQSSGSIKESDYRAMLSKGGIIFIFDGYDELLEEKKGKIQQQLIRMAESFPKSPFENGCVGSCWND